MGMVAHPQYVSGCSGGHAAASLGLRAPLQGRPYWLLPSEEAVDHVQWAVPMDTRVYTAWCVTASLLGQTCKCTGANYSLCGVRKLALLLK